MTYTLLQAIIPVLLVPRVWDLRSCDLTATSEGIHIECIITIVPLEDRARNRNCPHSFEKTAILDSITISKELVAEKPVAKSSNYELLYVKGNFDAYLSPSSRRRNVLTTYICVLALEDVP